MVLNSSNVHRFVTQSDARLCIARLTLQLTTIKYIFGDFTYNSRRNAATAEAPKIERQRRIWMHVSVNAAVQCASLTPT